MPLCNCSAAALATIAIPTSSTWTWGPCAAGKLAFHLSLRIRITLRESLLQSLVVSVNIVKEVYHPIFQHDSREVDDQDRNRVREIYLLGRRYRSWRRECAPGSSRDCRAAPMRRARRAFPVGYSRG